MHIGGPFTRQKNTERRRPQTEAHEARKLEQTEAENARQIEQLIAAGIAGKEGSATLTRRLFAYCSGPPDMSM